MSIQPLKKNQLFKYLVVIVHKSGNVKWRILHSVDNLRISSTTLLIHGS